MNGYTSAPLRALILCEDARLSRLLETELAYMGVAAQAVDAPSLPDEELCLLVADGDSLPVAYCEELAVACGCPLLVFGREPASLSLPPDRGVLLRRPFALPELELAIRGLLAGLTAAGAPMGAARPLPAPPAAPHARLRITEEGEVTVDGKPLSLTPTELAILEQLRTHRGETVTREALAPLLGGGGNIVDVYVCRLRRKLEKPLGVRLIHTVRGVGYRMEREPQSSPQ